MNKVDIRIMGVPQRRELINRMLTALDLGPEIVSLDDRPGGGDAMYTARKAWSASLPSGTTHRLVLQDDLELCHGFREIVERAAAAFPDNIFSFFDSISKPEDRQNPASPYVRVPGSKVYGPACMMPGPMIADCFNWLDRVLPGHRHDDEGISGFAMAYQIPVMTTIPSILQHTAPNASILKVNNYRKVSKVWTGLDVSEENWDTRQFSKGRHHTYGLMSQFVNKLTKAPYNTALKGENFEFKDRDRLVEIEWFENDRGIIFAHDLCRKPTLEMMKAYRKAECIISDLAWPHGYKTFAKRAGTTQSGSYGAYLEAIRQLVLTLRVPSFITGSMTHALALQPDLITTIKLNGPEVALAVWNEPVLPLARDSWELVNALSCRYRSVLDFSCGYGRIFRPFRYFIGSDIDKKCLGYIKTEIMSKPLVQVFAEEKP